MQFFFEFGGLDDKFFMVGKVGTGFNDTTRTFLKNRLMRDHGFFKSDKIPSWIHEDYVSTDLPSHFVNQDNMQVVEVFFLITEIKQKLSKLYYLIIYFIWPLKLCQIRAKGLRNGRLYAPTLKTYRDDKYVKDIDQYQEFLDFDKVRVGLFF